MEGEGRLAAFSSPLAQLAPMIVEKGTISRATLYAQSKSVNANG